VKSLVISCGLFAVFACSGPQAGTATPITNTPGKESHMSLDQPRQSASSSNPPSGQYSSDIAGYRYGDPSLPAAPISAEQFGWLEEAVLLGDDDIAALRRSGPILEPHIDEILDVWYGFVGAKPFLLAQFSDRGTGAPIPEYLDRVRARFSQWILDTAAAEYDDAWLRWQFEIGRRHHRVGKNRTDGANASALVPMSHMILLAQPIVDTLRPFLESGGDDRDTVDAMQNAWRKAVLLQVTLWSYPYVLEGDF
jgi:hypothetical protein